jgi:hypothetical protein
MDKVMSYFEGSLLENPAAHKGGRRSTRKNRCDYDPQERW